MKILIVSQYYWPESFKINDLALELKKNGHDITVYTGMPNYPLGKIFDGYSFFRGPFYQDQDGIKVIRSPLIPRLFANSRARGLGLILNYLSFAIFASLLAPFLVRGKYDRIFMYEVSPIFSALPAVMLRFIKKAPMIIWITDLWPESLAATGTVTNPKVLALVGLVVRFIYRHSDLIYTSSRGFIPRIEKHGVDKNKIKYWPQWAESLFTENNKSDYTDEALPKTGFKLLFAGNIGTAQDIPTIIAAAEKLKEHKDIHFIFLGDGVARKQNEQLVKSKNLANVYFLGKKPLQTMPYYYSEVDALLVSLNNSDLFTVTLPAKLQSYLASKKAVLACLNGEGAEIVNNWQAGLSCPAGEPDLLAETILRFSKISPTQMHEMGENAFNCYQAEFSKAKLMAELEQDLKTIQTHS